MKNELGRKITSLTLMTIMFAGGLTIAAPSFMPEAVADEKLLYVSNLSDFLTICVYIFRKSIFVDFDDF